MIALWPLGLFVVLAALIYTVAGIVLRLLPSLPQPRLLLSALAFDLTFTITACFALLPMRRLRWHWSTAIAVFLVCHAIAAAALPSEGQGALRWLAFGIAPSELLLLVLIARAVASGLRDFRRSLSSDAFAEAAPDMLVLLQGAARAGLHFDLLADVLASELAVFYYAFSRPAQLPADAAEGEKACSFSYHERCEYGGFVTGFFILMGFEAIAVHLLVASLWSQLAAWILSALSLYGMLLLLADLRASQRRPHLLGEDSLTLRLGLRCTVELPFELIRGVHRQTPGESSPRGTQSLKLLSSAETSLVLELREPVTVQYFYGLRRPVSRIELALDDAAGFERALQKKISASAA